MTDVSPAPGWWLASDDHWYPPELSSDPAINGSHLAVPGASQAPDRDFSAPLTSTAISPLPSLPGLPAMPAAGIASPSSGALPPLGSLPSLAPPGMATAPPAMFPGSRYAATGSTAGTTRPASSPLGQKRRAAVRKVLLRRIISIVVVACLIVTVVAVVSPGFRQRLMNTFSHGTVVAGVDSTPVNINAIPGGRFTMPTSPPANLDGLSLSAFKTYGVSAWKAQVVKETGGTSNSFAGIYGTMTEYNEGVINGFGVVGAEPSTDLAAVESAVMSDWNQDHSLAIDSHTYTWTTWAPPPTSLGNTFKCSMFTNTALAEGVGNCIWSNAFEVVSVTADTTNLTAMETLIESVVSELHSR